MQLNINLLQDLPTQIAEKYLSKTFLQLVSAGFVVVLLAIYFVNLGLYYKDKNALEKLLLTKQTTTKQLSQIQDQITFARRSRPATTNITNTQNISTNPKFSLYLKKLALYTPHGVWLNQLNISQKNDFFSVNGYAIKSFAVLEFIKSIAQNLIFNGHQLNTIKIQQNPNDKTISFSLSNVESRKQ